METDFKDEAGKAALQCFQRGWLHAGMLDVFGMLYKTGHLFPSPVHQWFVEWMLLDTFPDITFDAENLLAFTVEVISHYCPANLTRSRRIGPGCIQQPLEARHQDEIYRCSHGRSNRSIVTFPEFGLGIGRADLYILTKRWGLDNIPVAFRSKSCMREIFPLTITSSLILATLR